MVMMRANYDKPWRCPAWSGPALSAPRKNAPLCDGGSLAQSLMDGQRLWDFRAHRCPRCGTVILPAILIWVDLEAWKAGILWHRITRRGRRARHFVRTAGHRTRLAFERAADALWFAEGGSD